MQTFILSAIFLSVISSTQAWGDDGHRMVAHIASTMLNPTAAQIVAQFLGDRNITDIATVPDDYDHTWSGKWSKPMHYVNMNRGQTNFSMSEDCSDLCVVGAIQNYTQRLTNEQSNPFECSSDKYSEPCALIFLVHFVGDSHQPLHVGYTDDDGGNTVNVSFFNGTGYINDSLHSIWDTWMILEWENDWYNGARALEKMMPNQPSLVKYYASITDPIVWADESYHYVESTVYDFSSELKSKQMNKMNINDEVDGDEEDDDGPVVSLGQKYYDRNIPIIKQRLIAAGVRLGTLLNTILTG